MLDRIQVISRLLDIASYDYRSDKVRPRENSNSIEEEIEKDVVQNVIRLIEEMTIPKFWNLSVDHLPDPPKDAFSPRKFNNFEDQKKWHYSQEFFYEILGCIDFISDEENNPSDIEMRKDQCIQTLIHWQDSLERYGKRFRKENFKLL